MTIIWKEGYTTGSPELDQQHREMFHMLNQLEDMINREVYQGPEVNAFLKSLGTYVTRHFSDEECCMDKAQCPMAEKNRQEHEQFLNKYVELTSIFSVDKSLESLKAIHDWAESWTHEHVAFLDIHLRTCVNRD